MAIKITIEADDVLEIKNVVKELNENFDSEELLFQKKKRLEDIFNIARSTKKHCAQLEQFKNAMQQILEIAWSEIE